jgi:2-keto-4-pentenoate hydratase/2-oxohepta-3-ene-1,7-dioic acid hydratase in catechol pathway
MEILLPTTGERIVSPRLFCIGRNYASHAREMNSAVPTVPMVFLKPSTALVPTGGRVILPAMSNEVHHEVELVVVIGKRGKDIPEAEAMGYVAGYAVGLDMTARDLQAEAKKSGAPWTVAKGFDTFAPLGPIAPAAALPDPQHTTIQLRINGAVRQDGRTADMIFSIPRLITHCSQIFTLLPGDLLYTGTPEGVGPVHEGDHLEATVAGLPPLSVTVAR